MKKTWKHINLEQRKLISSGIAHNDKLIERSKRIAQISSQGSLTTDFLFSGYKFPIRTVKK